MHAIKMKISLEFSSSIVHKAAAAAATSRDNNESVVNMHQLL
jgi:hypothetical protein